MRFPTVLLDFDHTLFDSDASELAAFDSTLRAAGVAEPARHFDAYVRINLPLWAAVERGELRPQDVRVRRFEQLAGEIGLDADPAAMAEWFVTGLAAHGELYPGARAVLDDLAGRCRLALVTNGLSEVQRTRVDRLGIGAYFDAVVISAEIGSSKPAASFFDVTFELLGGPPRDGTLMVGDSLSADVRGGADYGLTTCWYNPHRRPAGGVTAHHEIERLDELPPLVTAAPRL